MSGRRSRTSSRRGRTATRRTTSSPCTTSRVLGVTSHSKVPLRLATMAGFALSVVALLVALAYLVLKLAWWQTFDLGLAPLVIGVYFLGAVQLFFVGLLGEYIGSIHTQVHRRPLVVEKERINFDTGQGPSPRPRAGVTPGVVGPAVHVSANTSGVVGVADE